MWSGRFGAARRASRTARRVAACHCSTVARVAEAAPGLMPLYDELRALIRAARPQTALPTARASE